MYMQSKKVLDAYCPAEENSFRSYLDGGVYNVWVAEEKITVIEKRTHAATDMLSILNPIR